MLIYYDVFLNKKWSICRCYS